MLSSSRAVFFFAPAAYASNAAGARLGAIAHEMTARTQQVAISARIRVTPTELSYRSIVGHSIDAGNFKPAGVALRGVRFNPAPGSQE